MHIAGVENYARFLLKDIDVVPVNLRTVAGALAKHRKAGIKMARVPMPDSVGGMAIFEAGTYVLGVNSKHNHTKRRTTLAHEIAEVALGQLRNATVYQLLKQRNTKREARAFRLARAILVPDWFVTSVLEAYHVNPAEMAKFIANKCKVSLDVACLRIRDFNSDYEFELFCKDELLFAYGSNGVNSGYQVKTSVKMGDYILVGSKKIS